MVWPHCWLMMAIRSSTPPMLLRMLRPVLKLLKPFSNLYVDGRDLGRAMIQATLEKIQNRLIENSEIRELASRYSKIRQRIFRTILPMCVDDSISS